MARNDLDRRQNLDPKDSPKALLGKHLRRLRLAAGFTTQAAAAARLDGYGEDSISKAETGAQVPVDDLYDKLLDLYGASDLDRLYLGDLLVQARQGKTSSGVPDFAKPWLHAEQEAEFLRMWAITLVPGLFQTPGYARPLFEVMGLSEDKVEEQVALRMGRQGIFDDGEGIQVVAILEESVLYRLIGSPSVMAEELDHLLELSRRPTMTIQIVKANGANPGLAGAFEIASTHGMPDTVVMPAVEDQTSEDHALTRKSAVLFEQIRRQALSVEDSRAVIMEGRDHWKSQH
jgi:hypothetical protein